MRPAADGRRRAFPAALVLGLAFAGLWAGCSRDPVVLRVGDRQIRRSRFESDYQRVAKEDTTLFGEKGLRAFLDDYANKNTLELLAREKYPTLTPEQEQRQWKTERDLLRDEIRRRDITSRIRPVSVEEAQAFHHERRNAFVARHIMLASKPEAEEVLGEIRQGGDFAALAAARSADSLTAVEGGLLKRFSRGMLVPEFEDAVAAMKPGDVGFVETPFGFHVVRLDSIVARADTMPFESERRRIEDLLRARQIRRLRVALLDSLMSGYGARLDDEGIAWFDAKVVAAGGRRPVPTLAEEEMKRVLATYEGGQVTAADYLDCLRERSPGQLPQGGDLHGQRESLKDCLFNALCAAEGKRRGIDKEPDIADILRDREEKLRVTRLYIEEIEESVGVSDEDYRAFFEEHRDEFAEPEAWSVQLIGVRDSTLAAAVVQEWAGGAEFNPLVARCHARDSLGVNSPEDGLRLFDTPDAAAWVGAVRGLEIGAVGGPAFMDGLYYAVRLRDHTPSRPRSYDEAFDSVRFGTEAEKKEARLKQLLDDGKKRFPVVVNERALRGVKLSAPSETPS